MAREGKMTQKDCNFFNKRIDQKAAKAKQSIDNLAETIKVSPDDTPKQVQVMLQVEEEIFSRQSRIILIKSRNCFNTSGVFQRVKHNVKIML